MDGTDVETRIREALAREGPLTGGELLDATGLEVFRLWKTCVDLPDIVWKIVGRRYLRLDRTVPGFGRLSPSIKREFLTYTVLAPTARAEEQARRAQALDDEIRRISREKHLLARTRLRGVVEDLADPRPARDDMCFLIAGDIVYEMAHAVNRPETSTGKMVRGSDLDIVVVTRDAVSPEYVAELDRAILREKYRLLTHPSYREEIDYLIKPLARVREQLRFDTFEHRVASKILHEGKLLLGSRDVFEELQGLLRKAAVPSKLARLQRRARAYRLDAEVQLKGWLAEPSEETLRRYFHTKEEAPELF